MSSCLHYTADKVFKNFKVVELPISMVGLYTVREVNVGVDLNYCAYIKTNYEGHLMDYAKAQEKSAGHRAFQIEQLDKDLIRVTFKPTSECISKAKHEKQFENRFVVDLCLIRVDDVYCCFEERHLECGRIYLSGQFEYCNISHTPKILNFGEIKINTKLSQYVEIHNNASDVYVHLEYLRTTGYHLFPSSFTIGPQNSVRIEIIAKPVSLKIANFIVFRIYNYHGSYGKDIDFNEKNCLTHHIKIKIKVLLNTPSKKRQVVIESLHKLIEPIPCCTYVGEELAIHLERKKIAFQHLEVCKSMHKKKVVLETLCTGNVQCYSDVDKVSNTNLNFCDRYEGHLVAPDVPHITLTPFIIDFGKVAVSTYAEGVITMKNNTKYDVTVYFMHDPAICYTKDNLRDLFIKLKGFSGTDIIINCLGLQIGSMFGTFQYTIDHKFFRHHPYSLDVDYPYLYLLENNLKFGMIASDNFVTSVATRICNDFNVGVEFRWCDLSQDAPFKIAPRSGTVPKHSCIMCDVRYDCKPTKTKLHEVDFLSLGETIQNIPVELNIITRKISMKFLQSTLHFRDIPLNIETIEKVSLENSSREMATFHVVEPLIPGFTMDPMHGIIGPKMIITFEVKVKIACILEFSFEIYVKINNKENVTLVASGNVIEPRLSIFPKHIFMNRVPCNLITYVTLTLQNQNHLPAVVDVLNPSDDNIFKVFIAIGNEKRRVFRLNFDAGETKIVYVKITDFYRREYEQFVPFKINGMLGPPDISDPETTELQFYTGPFMELYENNSKVKLKPLLKDISYCRLVGVITVPWIQFSTNKFEIVYDVTSDNNMKFTMKNVSKYFLYITILTGKLSPNFSLDLLSDQKRSIVDSKTECINFEFEKQDEAELMLTFHPKSHGKFVVDALLYLDKHLSLPFYNLTFVGRREVPVMEPSVYSIVFPPTCVDSVLLREFYIKIKCETAKENFRYHIKDEDFQSKIEFSDCTQEIDNDDIFSILKVRLSIHCNKSISKYLFINFYHDAGSCCEVQVLICATYCPLTLHASLITSTLTSPFPFYPLPDQIDLYKYMERSKDFLEKWMFQQGFRREFYPVIPDSFHSISETSAFITKNKGINVSFMNYIKRVAGPLLKHLKKLNLHTHNEDPVVLAKEIHANYKEIVALMLSRGANLLHMHAKYLLSYEQFIIYTQEKPSKNNVECLLTQELLKDEKLFDRLNKQCWIDFLLQSYKVFILDSCFFECVCVSHEPRNIIQIITNWYNEHIEAQHFKLRGPSKEKKVITNITTDLIDGIAIISVLLSYCPFLEPNLRLFTEIGTKSKEGDLINNACIIIEALNLLRIFFPITTSEILEPNFLQMLFLSVHLYVVLPMFHPKEILIFSPPLLRSSTRYLSIAPCNQESLVFNFFIVNNHKNTFLVEKGYAENGKKMSINVKYNANFVEEEFATLIVYGYNKTRIFDTYIVFILNGKVGGLLPFRKYKVVGPLYRQCRVDIMISSPFPLPSTYTMIIKDDEPTLPTDLEDDVKPKFYLRRLNLIDNEVVLAGASKDFTADIIEHRIYFQLICLTTHINNSWIWFRSIIGEFFVRVTTQPRWDLAIDSLQAQLETWPIKPCSCGDSCECYRTMILSIPHRNDLKVKALRLALQEMASDVMLEVFDELIGSDTGKIIIYRLLAEGGTIMSEVGHILRREITYRVTARSLILHNDKVKLQQHTDQILLLPVTIPAYDRFEKFSVTLTSECGADVRTYKVVIFNADQYGDFNSYSKSTNTTIAYS